MILDNMGISLHSNFLLSLGSIEHSFCDKEITPTVLSNRDSQEGNEASFDGRNQAYSHWLAKPMINSFTPFQLVLTQIKEIDHEFNERWSSSFLYWLGNER